jgi:predicted PurR-regulated permease PerM
MDEGRRDRGRAGEPAPAWVRSAILRLLLGAGALVASFWLFAKLRDLLLLLVVSLFLALAVEPAVNVLAGRGWRRGLATGLVFAALLLAVAVFAIAIGPLFVDQVGELVDAIPGYADAMVEFVNDTFGTDLSSSELAAELRGSQGVRDFATGVAAAAVGLSTTLVGLVFQGFTVLLFSFYLVADGPRFRRAVCSRLRPERQREVLGAWELAIEKTGGYVYSRTLLAACSAVATWLALALIGVPYPLALGLWTGLVSQFIPTVGTYLAGALPVLIALLTEPVLALWTLAFIVVYQQVENYLLSPRVTAHTMALHPAVAFGAVIAGGAAFGPAGALLALPATASLQAFASTYARRYEVVSSPLTATEQPERRSGATSGPA